MTFIPEQKTRQTFLRESISVKRDAQLSILPIQAGSVFRDILNTENGSSGGFSPSDGEFVLSTSTDANSSVDLETKIRGTYSSGFSLESGVGIRIPVLPSGNQEARWGYFDGYDGLGFGVDSSGLFIFVRSGESDTIIRQEDWNIDNSSIDVTEDFIYEMTFSWYGYGTLEFSIVKLNGIISLKERIVVHRFNRKNAISVINPNLPVRIEASNNGTSGEFDVNIGGRQITSIGKGEVLAKKPTETAVINVGAGASEAVIALRKKNTFNGLSNGIQVRLNEIALQSSEAVQFKIFFNVDSITGGSFRQPDTWPADETAVEVNTSEDGLTGFSGGIIVESGFVEGTQGGATISAIKENLSLFLGVDETIIVEVTNLGGAASDINVVLNWIEQI